MIGEELHRYLRPQSSAREFLIGNLLVRIHLIIVMTRWTGLAPWEFAFLFSGSRTAEVCRVGLCTCTDIASLDLHKTNHSLHTPQNPIFKPQTLIPNSESFPNSFSGNVPHTTFQATSHTRQSYLTQLIYQLVLKGRLPPKNVNLMFYL